MHAEVFEGQAYLMSTNFNRSKWDGLKNGLSDAWMIGMW